MSSQLTIPPDDHKDQNHNTGDFWRNTLPKIGLSILALTLLICGASMIFSAIADMFIAFSLNDEAVEVEGTVVRIETEQVRDSNNGVRTISLPVISFVYQDRRYEFTPTAVSGARQFAVDETLPVIFPPENPDAAVLAESPHTGWLVTLVMGVMMLTGAVLLFMVVRLVHQHGL